MSTDISDAHVCAEFLIGTLFINYIVYLMFKYS